jgi:hypothetical protein
MEGMFNSWLVTSGGEPALSRLEPRTKKSIFSLCLGGMFYVWCLDVTSTPVSTTDNYDLNVTTQKCYMQVTLCQPYVMILDLTSTPCSHLEGPVTHNTTSHLVYLGCDITSNFLLSDLSQKCHKSLRCPISHTQLKSTNTRVSVLCALT